MCFHASGCVVSSRCFKVAAIDELHRDECYLMDLGLCVLFYQQNPRITVDAARTIVAQLLGSGRHPQPPLIVQVPLACARNTPCVETTKRRRHRARCTLSQSMSWSTIDC